MAECHHSKCQYYGGFVEGDNLETMNSKLIDDEGKGIEIGISDLLNEDSLMDEQLLKKKRKFELDCEEGLCTNACNDRLMEFVRVEEVGEENAAKILLYESKDILYGN